MITPIPYATLGHADYGWLDARYHFSFFEYRDPERMGFGLMRVINDDTIAAGAGFETHPHRDMEIISYVRKGAITHRDSKGNVGRTEAGDVQVMSAGSGIHHSEYNLESEETKLYQIWIRPNKRAVEPRWDTAKFPKEASNELSLLVSGDGTAPLQIHQDAYIRGGVVKAGEAIRQPIKHQAYLLVSEGEVKVEGHALQTGDAAEIIGQSEVRITAQTDAELVLIDVPAEQ